MKIVSWNCRGLGGYQKIEVIKRIKSMEYASILLIQETKKSAVDSMETLQKVWPKGTCLAIDAIGASGGILCWWNKDQFKLLSAIENRNWMFIKMENVDSQEKF